MCKVANEKRTLKNFVSGGWHWEGWMVEFWKDNNNRKLCATLLLVAWTCHGLLRTYSTMRVDAICVVALLAIRRLSTCATLQWTSCLVSDLV